MLTLGSLAFLSPWLLAGLAALPVLWWLMRAIPPSPKRQVFAGVRLLQGLEDEERQTDRTPWWLLLLRCLAVAAAILGFAQPVQNLTDRIGVGGGPLLVLMDQGWASAPDWDDRVSAVREILTEAGQADRPVLFWPIAGTAEAPPPVLAGAALRVLDAARPQPWAPDHAAVLAALKAGAATGAVAASETVWLHDGLAHEGTRALLDWLAGRGRLRLIGPEFTAKGLTPPRIENGTLTADVLRASAGDESVPVVAMARAEGGGERRIGVGNADFRGNAARAPVTFDLPVELRHQVTRLVLAVRPSAGGAVFADGAIRRVTAGLVAPETAAVIASLTSPVYYLEQALAPWADLVEGDILTVLKPDPAAIVLIDRGDITEAERTALTDWVRAGGLLIRFAGPRLAAAIGANGVAAAATGADELLPVRLRRGGRVLGGALAWSTPRGLGPFDPDGPFRGLEAPGEVQVRTQVLAEPSPALEGHVWARLDDGTPLVTGKRLGAGHVVLFHVSADAEWSSLPLSGLFVQMLGRLLTLAPGRTAGVPDAGELAGTLWRADLLMGTDGTPRPAPSLAETVPGERLAEARPGPDLPPGIYARAGADGASQNGADDRAPGLSDSVVINVTRADSDLVPFPPAPQGVVIETLGGAEPVRYGPWLIALALLIATADVLGTLIASGRLGIRRRAPAGTTTLIAVVAVAGLALLGAPPEAWADDAPIPPEWIAAAAETTLGWVRTGDPRIDRVSERGLVGLGQALTRRTAVEPGPPVGITPGEDELSFYPVLYWPLTAGTLPDADELGALALYIRGGGLLIIDTQDGASGFAGAGAAEMRAIARALNLPPLAPVADDHVLTRTFYLLDDFPGRWRGGRIWAEAPPLRAEGAEPLPADLPHFDRVDDNVSPVIVGSADWAAAWAVDQQGLPLFPVGRPGDRQREMALRFGINAVIYALTGNYKSDQVHAPEVLRRLGR